MLSDVASLLAHSHLLEQVHGDRVARRVQGLEVDRRFAADALEELFRLARLDVGDLSRVRASYDVEDQSQLMDEVLAREEGLSPEKLGEDTADRPHIHASGVKAVGAQHKLRGAVPPSHNVLGHGLLDLRRESDERSESPLALTFPAHQHIGPPQLVVALSHLLPSFSLSGGLQPGQAKVRNPQLAVPRD